MNRYKINKYQLILQLLLFFCPFSPEEDNQQGTQSPTNLNKSASRIPVLKKNASLTPIEDIEDGDDDETDFIMEQVTPQLSLFYVIPLLVHTNSVQHGLGIVITYNYPPTNSYDSNSLQFLIN